MFMDLLSPLQRQRAAPTRLLATVSSSTTASTTSAPPPLLLSLRTHRSLERAPMVCSSRTTRALSLQTIRHSLLFSSSTKTRITYTCRTSPYVRHATGTRRYRGDRQSHSASEVSKQPIRMSLSRAFKTPIILTRQTHQHISKTVRFQERWTLSMATEQCSSSTANSTQCLLLPA